MNYATDYIAKTLRETRENKGLSQRELAKLAGVTQNHISKIENGLDLRISSLVEVARALDLELALVPRKSIPAIQAIARSQRPLPKSAAAIRETKEMMEIVSRLAASLSHQDSANLAKLRRATRDISNFNLESDSLKSLKEANSRIRKALRQASADQQNLALAFRESLNQYRTLRNQLAHALPTAEKEPVRPAYSLEGDDA
jgi:transcriptional regulator with XRE-family HTH domain